MPESSALQAKNKTGDTMKPTRNVALDCAMGCLAVGVVSMIAISPASAEGASDSSPNIAPALKCVDLTGWKIPNSTTVVTKAQEVPEAPPGTVQPRPYLSHCRQTAVRMA